MSPIFLFIFLQFFSLIYSTPLAPALYVFGDSMLDNGNNNLLPTIAKANYEPYGVNFVQGVTGRFTNGRTVADFIAEYLGLPFSPPCISIRESIPLTGLNYASASCGILPETGSSYGKRLNLDGQIDLFQRTVQSDLPKYIKSSNELSNYLSKSLFVFGIGSNDYIGNYLQSSIYNTSKRYTPQPFAQLLVDQLSQRFERLYNLGARKVVMFEIGPIGCIPYITRQHKHTGQCVEESNQLVSYFNNKLPSMLRNLTSTLQGSNFVLGHVNWLSYDAAINPHKYELTDTSNPCCTTWENGTSVCIPLTTPCPQPDKHYFWDAYHLTEVMYSVITSRCINDKSVCIPYNIKELIQM